MWPLMLSRWRKCKSCCCCCCCGIWAQGLELLHIICTALYQSGWHTLLLLCWSHRSCRYDRVSERPRIDKSSCTNALNRRDLRNHTRNGRYYLQRPKSISKIGTSSTMWQRSRAVKITMRRCEWDFVPWKFPAQSSK